MFTASSQLRVILICGPTDMRKAIDGLCNIVAYDLEKEPCGDHIFVFCGRARDKVKTLQWASNGFCKCQSCCEMNANVRRNNLPIFISPTCVFFAKLM